MTPDEIVTVNLRNLPSYLSNTEPISKAIVHFFCTPLGNIFAVVIVFKQNKFIAVKLLLCYLLYIHK